MHTNSLEVHKDNLAEGKYPKQIKMIVKSLEYLESATMHQIANHLRVPLNTISGRFKRMREEGIIKEVGRNEKRRTIFKLTKKI